jgi:alkyl hydroperoxide reductase subunit AhpF
MALISASDQTLLRAEFAKMTRSVHLLFVTQTLECDTCLQTRQILDELPPLSDRISIDEVNLVLDRDKAAQYGIDVAPAIALAYEDGSKADGATVKDSRIRFLGTPAGYEFISLVRAVLLVGGGRESELSPQNLARLASIDKPVAMQVFTTPS